MPRHLGLIALILEYVSKADKNLSGTIDLPDELPGYSRDQMFHHIMLCQEAGYLEIIVEVNPMCSKRKMPKEIIRMTWDGYEALEKRFSSYKMEVE